jgi:hypothetical protein
MDITTPKVAATQFTAYMAMLNLTISYTAVWQGWAIEKLGYPATLTLDAALGDDRGDHPAVPQAQAETASVADELEPGSRSPSECRPRPAMRILLWCARICGFLASMVLSTCVILILAILVGGWNVGGAIAMICPLGPGRRLRGRAPMAAAGLLLLGIETFEALVAQVSLALLSERLRGCSRGSR